jgi:hypothetical protein
VSLKLKLAESTYRRVPLQYCGDQMLRSGKIDDLYFIHLSIALNSFHPFFIQLLINRRIAVLIYEVRNLSIFLAIYDRLLNNHAAVFNVFFDLISKSKSSVQYFLGGS